MKTALRLVLGLLFSLPAMAGTPDEDPVVQYLRTAYENGVAPTADQLYFSNLWECRIFVAHPFSIADQPGNGTTGFKFAKYDGLVLNTALETSWFFGHFEIFARQPFGLASVSVGGVVN